jgi:hypothetical protein
MTTPVWVPLLVAGLGIAGVFFTQWRSDKRESATWARDRRRERERWAREDAARTFDHRRDAHVDFYESLREMARSAYNFGTGLTDALALAVDWQLPTFRKLQHLRTYASTRRPTLPKPQITHTPRRGHGVITLRLLPRTQHFIFRKKPTTRPR